MILIVDDDHNMTYWLQKALPEYSVITSNAYDAVRIIHHGGINLLITDYHMPGKTGLDLLKLVKSKYKIPVIIMTGYTDKLDVLRQKADKVLAKPFTIEELKEAIVETLDTYKDYGKIEKRKTELA